jgi:5-methylcytosine-specific restriction endonuclease McrA
MTATPKRWGGRKVARARASFGTGPLSCAICAEAIDRSLRYPHPRSLSVDHAVPRSQGGRNARTNYLPAHLTCNVSRGSRPLGEVRPNSVLRTSRERT